MNVLVYSGPEVIQASFDHTLSTLRAILHPFYSVQTITHQALVSQPWQAACTLLVFPGCREIFLSKASSAINDYVQAGGAFLAFGTGSHYTARGGLNQGILNVTSSSISKDLMLRFFDKESGSYIHPNGSDDAPRAVAIQPTEGDRLDVVFQSGTCDVVGVEGGRKNARVLARYVDNDAVAGVIYTVGAGKVALWACSPEYPLTEEPASSMSMAASLSPEAIDLAESRRRNLVKQTLLLHGLQIPEEGAICRPLPQFLASHFIKPDIVSRIADAIAAPSSGAQLTTFEDANDKFHFHELKESEALLRDTRLAAATRTDPSTWQPKHIVICRDGQIPGHERTPLFDLTLFFSALSAARKREGISEEQTDSWGIGDALLYGEAVTSTQTMLDKNPRLLGLLPTPLLSLASHQLAGRGRGANVWLSPSGCLQFSLLLRLSLSTFPASKLVFVQYLFALAVVEACRDETVLGADAGSAVRLKWPNDIYAVLDGEKKKIGGILVNTSFSGGKVDIIIGSGLNVLNPPPITSLSQLLPPDESDTQLSMERTAAAILVKFETMWSEFVQGRGSFEPFMSLYLRRWMHSDQLVTLTTTTPHQQVRITGITPDHGLLRTIPERGSGGFIDLQPDGNSFDLMAGMIKTKS
ncbi:class II aaRS and biotin synthetase [Roridomyces roridus]|uniref:Class II aaRS and biotin synthetase n=1 Tax=Roridomyces roridus TaxID=1738132 RepID=A0AAD7FJN2_9AGAR|nr:class II aaRS and biotin synthetase [Roridomyces roridus]